MYDMHTRICACVRTYMHTQAATAIGTGMRGSVDGSRRMTYIHAYVRAYIHTYLNTQAATAPGTGMRGGVDGSRRRGAP